MNAGNHYGRRIHGVNGYADVTESHSRSMILTITQKGYVSTFSPVSIECDRTALSELHAAISNREKPCSEVKPATGGELTIKHLHSGGTENPRFIVFVDNGGSKAAVQFYATSATQLREAVAEQITVLTYTGVDDESA